jgi:hypothetical protein
MRIGSQKDPPWWFRGAVSKSAAKVEIRIAVNIGKQGGSAQVLTLGPGVPMDGRARRALQKASKGLGIPIDSSIAMGEEEREPQTKTPSSYSPPGAPPGIEEEEDEVQREYA